MTSTTRWLLAVLDAEAFINRSSEASVGVKAGKLTCQYRGWDGSNEQAYQYFLNGKPVDAEGAARILEEEAKGWDD